MVILRCSLIDALSSISSEVIKFPISRDKRLSKKLAASLLKVKPRLEARYCNAVTFSSSSSGLTCSVRPQVKRETKS
jgi:hypothetical protein